MPDHDWEVTPVTQPATNPPAVMTDAQFALFQSLEWTKTRSGAHGTSDLVTRAEAFYKFLTNPTGTTKS